MKNLYIALSFGLISTSLIAQNKDTKSADKLFNRYCKNASKDSIIK